MVLYIKSPEWLRNKRATINPQNKKDSNCFHYAVTVALNHQKIYIHPEEISKIKPHIDQYNWQDMDYTKETGKSLNKIIRQLL